LLTKERREIEIEIERFLVLFSRKREAIYRDKRLGERADPCLMLTSVLKKGDMRLFQTY